MRLVFSFFYLLSIGFLPGMAACKNLRDKSGPAGETQTSQSQESSMKSARKPPGAVAPGPENAGKQKPVPPDNCRLVGQVIRIFPDLAKDRADPCGQVPCRALVRVGQIMGYGKGFVKPLRIGQEIQVYFSLTLAPTAKYFPGLTPPLPGLAAGRYFQADVRQPGDGSDPVSPWYQVETYLVRAK